MIFFHLILQHSFLFLFRRLRLVMQYTFRLFTFFIICMCEIKSSESPYKLTTQEEKEFYVNIFIWKAKAYDITYELRKPTSLRVSR